MGVGDYVVASLEPAEYEPRLYQIRAMNRGRAELAQVNPTTGVISGSIKIDVYRLRSYRFLVPKEFEEFRRLVLDLRRQRASCRDFVNRLPLVADVG